MPIVCSANMRFFANPYVEPSIVNYSDEAIKAEINRHLTSILDKKSLAAASKDVEGGLYVGPAGIAYALWYAAKSNAIANSEAVLRNAYDIVAFNRTEMLHVDECTTSRIENFKGLAWKNRLRRIYRHRLLA